MFRTASSFARKLSVVVTVALLGGVLAPVATATSASAAAVPANGSYVCTTGLLRAGSDNSPAYTITNGVVSAGGRCEGAVVIPGGVTSIGSSAFEERTEIISVTIPASVASIGTYAFAETGLTSITFAEDSQLTSIGVGAFANATSLTSISIPASVTSIGISAFYAASALNDVNFLGNAPTVGSNAFLRIHPGAKAHISATATGFGTGETWYGLVVNRVKATPSVIAWPSASSITHGQSLSQSILTGGSASVAGSFAFTDPTITPVAGSNYQEVTFTPTDGDNYNPVTSTSDVSVVVNQAISTPADGSYVCTTGLLRDVSDNSPAYAITNGVVSQGWMCSGAVVIPSGVTSFGSMAFYMSSITSINIPASVTSIGESAFRFASVTSISIPATVLSIGDNAFAGTFSLTSIAVDSANQGFTSINGALFNKNATTLIQYPAGNSQTSYTIPEGVSSIESYAFYASTLTSITLPESLTSIGIDAFRSASSLTSVTIPANVTSISNQAFYGASSLKDAIFLGDAPTSVGTNVFSYIASEAKAHISATATGFGTESTWNGLVINRAVPVFSYYVFPNGTQARITGCSGCSSDLVIPSTIQDPGTSSVLTVSQIESGAFEAFGLTSVQIPNTVTAIGNRAFLGNSLSSVTIPSSVTSIGIRAFEANNLSSLEFLGDAPATLLDAFANNSNLYVAVVPSNANGFGETYQSLTVSRTGAAINRPSPVFSYDLNQDGASVTVTGCSANCVAELVVPSSLGGLSVTVIGEYAFKDKGLSSVVIPSSVTSILYGAFGDNGGLTSVTFLGNAPTDGGSIFYYTPVNNVVISSASSGWTYAFSGKKVIDENGQGLPGVFTFSVNENQTTATITGFSDPGVTQLVIPSSVADSSSGANLTVTNIGMLAFYGATSLASITIPAGVTSIELGAFYEASALNDVHFLGNAPASIGEYAFDGLASGAKARITATASGFGSGTTWNGLVIDRALPVNGSYVCTTGLLRAGGDMSLAYTLTNGALSNGNSCIGDVVIPAGVTSIGSYAFQQAPLTSITIPASVTSIGNLAFYYASSLNTVTFAQGSQLRSIGNRAFDSATAITSIAIPEGVTSIGNLAFYSATALTAIAIPASVTSIGYGAFDELTALTAITVDPTNQSFTSIDGVLFNKNASILIQYPVGKSATSYTIPASVTSIGEYAFYLNALTSITIPEGVTSIGEGAFQGATALTSITIPASVTSIGYEAFVGADVLSSVTFAQGSQLTSIEDLAFSYATGLTSISIPAGVTSIGYNAFEGATSLTSITIPAGVTSIEDYAFYGADSLKDVYFLGNAPTYVGEDVFYDIASGAKAHINSTATGFGSGYKWNGLVVAPPVPADGLYVCTTGLLREGSDTRPAYTINDGSVKLGSSCAGAVVIPRGVTSLAGSAFQNAAGLTSITIPSTVTSIGFAAFYNATALTSITIPPGVTSIPSNAFGGATSLTSVTIPEGVTYIGDSAFQRASALTSIAIPASVTSINNAAFANTSALTAITVNPANQNFTSIDGVLFNKDASSLIRYPIGKSATSLTIPQSVTQIASYAFEDATSLVSVTIPTGVTSIGIGAFKGATALTSVTIPAGVTSIGATVFYGATALTSITIPAGVTSIGSYAFRQASALKDVYFVGNAPDSVGYGAFSAIATGARANISATATGFGTESTWNDLVVMRPYGPGSSTGYVNCTQGSQITGSIVIVDFVVIQNNGCSGEVTIPATVTGIAANAFQNASTLTSIYFLGKAPTTVAANAFAGVSANATVYKTKSARFKLVDGKWNGLSVENAVVAKFYGNGSKVGTVPSAIMRPAGQSFVAPENTGGLGKNGYTFLGWNTLANGRGTSYAPGAVIEMRQAGMSLYTMWSQSPTKAETASKPVISGFTISTSNGKNSLGVTSGPWSGFPKPVLSYQWYSCTDKVSSFGSTVPETCSVIESATSSKLALTKRFKEKHIVVSVTGQSAGTSPTVWFSKSTTAIR